MDIVNLLVTFVSLIGIGAGITFLINTGKATGIVKDGVAANVSLVMNAVVFVGFVVAKLFFPNLDIVDIDNKVGQIAQIGILILQFIAQLGASKITYTAFRGTPVIGKSFSYDREQKSLNK